MTTLAATMARPTTTAAAARPDRDAPAWTSADLQRESGGVHRLDEADRAGLIEVLRAGRVPGESGVVHGDIEGRRGASVRRHRYDDACRRFDQARAESLGMQWDPATVPH